MLSQEDILHQLKVLKPKLYQDYSVKTIGLFSSFSRDTNSDDSDIYLVVELERPIGWKFLTLEIYLESIFNRKVDLVTKKALKSQLKDQILDEVKYI
jgi:predicted nucleotidyltransferase